MIKKKSLFISICVIFVFSMVFTLAGCNNATPSQNSISTLSATDLYGIGAVSTVKLLGTSVSPKAMNSLASVASTMNAPADPETTSTETAVKDQIKKFNDYFSALDSFLGDDIVNTTTVQNTDDKYADYSTKMTISGKDFNGDSVSYVMYYNEVQVPNAPDEEDESETTYKLTGVLVVDNVDYYLEGERTEETEGHEYENELKIRAYPDKTDKTSYIQMEQEQSIENGERENEYVYSVYSNNVLVEQTSVEFEFENKNGKTETEYALEFISGTSKGRYVIEREIVGSTTIIKVEYHIGTSIGEFEIREITTALGEKKYEYTFKDNSKWTSD